MSFHFVNIFGVLGTYKVQIAISNQVSFLTVAMLQHSGGSKGVFLATKNSSGFQKGSKLQLNTGIIKKTLHFLSGNFGVKNNL